MAANTSIFGKLFKKITSEKRVSLPDYVKRVSKSGDVPTEDSQVANKDITEFRYGTTTNDIVRQYSKFSPDLSAAVFSSVRLSLTRGYTLVARDFEGGVNPEATKFVQQVAKIFDATDDAKGFSNASSSIRSLGESLALELIRYGALCGEIVLDQGAKPVGMACIPVQSLVFKYKSNTLQLWQDVGSGDPINIDYPTVIYAALDQDIMNAYPESMMQAAIQPINQAQDYSNDLRKVTKRAFFPRVLVELDTDKWKKTLAPEVLYDAEALRKAMDLTITAVADVINEANPEDAFVFFDSATPSYLDHGNSSVSDEFKALNSIINGKLSSGAKTSPVVLGHDATGSTNIASTQSMLQTKNAEGVQFKINEFFTRAFTQIARLYGLDVYCEFAFDSIDLRPDSELESFKTMKQARTLQNLSLGYISDEEASIILTGSLQETGAPKLSGTMFYSSGGQTADNPYSNDSGTGRPANQALNDTVSAGGKQ